jgi:predicted metal-dependent enzyme (double-stranded beta helix superfamily)
MPTTLTPSLATPFTSRQLADVVGELASRPTPWLAIARFQHSGRWWRRLHHNDDVDIWLLTWMAGHRTEPHDHGGSAGAFAVVQGELTEVRLSADRCTTRTTIITVGEASRVERSTVHDVFNAGPAAAVSLHAYSPPLSRQTFFAPGGDGFVPSRRVETGTGSS